LDLEPGATATELKAAYLDLVKVWHPDRYQNEPERLRIRAQEKLKQVNEAYARLKGALPNDGTFSARPRPDGSAGVANEDLRPLQFGNEWGFVDGEGRLRIRPQFAWASGFHEGVARVAQPHPVYRLLYGFIDGEGHYTITPQFVNALDFSEGYAAAQFSQHWGYVDASGRFVIHPVFEQARSFRERCAAVRQRGQWGFIGSAGEYLVAPRYEEALDFQSGWGFVRGARDPGLSGPRVRDEGRAIRR
jgi:hypothetical protein